jgi:hypothetical protein
MPISSSWLDEEKHIMCTRIVGNWDVKDYYDAFSVTRKMLSEIEHEIVYILDLTRSKEPPIKFLSAAKNTQRGGQDNIRKLIFVNAGMLTKILVRTMAATSGRNAIMSYSNSMAEALEIAEKSRPETARSSR